MAESLAAALPKPKYTGKDEEIPTHAQPRGVRVVGPGQIDETRIVLRVGQSMSLKINDAVTNHYAWRQHTGPPPYGQRTSWRPRSQEDFGDGGAFPEIPIAQYPLNMGRRRATKSNALAIQVDGEGRIQYDAIARHGHAPDRIVHASFKDLIPLRQRAEAGEIDLSRPDAETIAATKERTAAALAAIVGGAVEATKPKMVAGTRRAEATYVRYQAAQGQMGDHSKKPERIIKIMERQRDPMEPARFKQKKIPRGPPSPPPPVMHSPPRKLTAEDQEMWRIPPPISNWKNPKGFTIPLDKRLAADGRGLQDVTINDKFAQLSEALFMADRHAREEVHQRALMQQRLAEKEKAQKEEQLREMARRAREAHAARGRRPSSREDSEESRRSRSRSSDGSRRRSSRSESESESEEEIREREKARQEWRREEKRKLQQSRMGAERKIQVMAREQNRDISEKIALGLAKPTTLSGEGMYDSRLFNRQSGFESGINEDNPYDKPLFAAQDAISSIYRPKVNADDDYEDEAAGDREMDKIRKAGRFADALGRGKFKGAAEAEVSGKRAIVTTKCHGIIIANRARDLQEREGPVQFEKSTEEVFNVDKFLSEVEQTQSSKRQYGLKESDSRQKKRARVGSEDDD